LVNKILFQKLKKGVDFLTLPYAFNTSS